jgi:hypothetical protein
MTGPAPAPTPMDEALNALFDHSVARPGCKVDVDSPELPPKCPSARRRRPCTGLVHRLAQGGPAVKICVSCDKPMRDEDTRDVPKMSPSGAGTTLFIHIHTAPCKPVPTQTAPGRRY